MKNIVSYFLAILLIIIIIIIVSLLWPESSNSNVTEKNFSVASTPITGEVITSVPVAIDNKKIQWGGMLPFITIFSLIVAGLASVTSFKFYSWRHRIDLTGALVPEKWAEKLEGFQGNMQELFSAQNSVNQAIQNFSDDSAKLSQFVQSGSNESLKQIKSSQEMLLTFQVSLEEKDKEIRRLKEGYDFKIISNLLSQLVSLHASNVEMLKRDSENKSLSNFEILLRDILESSGVEIFEPEIGIDFSEINDRIDVMGSTTVVNSRLKTGQISQVLSCGYIFKSSTGEKVMKKSKINYHLVEENT